MKKTDLFEMDNNTPVPNAELEDNTKASVLELMELITEEAEECGLTDRFFNEVRPLSEDLGAILDLTPRQAVFYSLFVNNYDDREIRLLDIVKHTRATMIRLAQLQDDIDALEMKRYIRRSDSFHSGVCYHVPAESIKCLRANKPFVPKRLTNLSIQNFIDELNDRVCMRYNLNEPYELMLNEVLDLMNDNMHLKICKVLKEQYEVLTERDWVLLVTLCVSHLFHEGAILISNLDRIFNEMDYRVIACELSHKNNKLMKEGLIDYACEDGMVNMSAVAITRKAYNLLLSTCPKKGMSPSDSNLLDHKKIAAKTLFYEADVKEQVDRLADMLTRPKFREICKRLRANKMRRGFACLFYGAPGTGKTETVLQLAKLTGRKIMQVDFSEVKDKYVGESEKNVKAIFHNYRRAVASEKPCPILLFNEADAIIGKRLNNVEHSVDNMYNTMQNIILQEMENFEGILIATTNLETNMDPAFERRFLYKVRFEKPSQDVRRQIWQSIIPSLSDEVALALAGEFAFSGGQIENIARKQLVDNILYGDAPDIYASLRAHCKAELIQNRQARRAAGFAA